FFSSRRRHTRSYGDWSSDVCSSDLFSGCAKCSRPFARPAPAARVPPVPFPAAAFLRSSGTNRARQTTARKETPGPHAFPQKSPRSEERRVGKEGKTEGGQED